MNEQYDTPKDTPDNVVVLPTQQYSEEQALTWLRERGRITASASHLARVWGWHERRTRRKLESWEHAGLIRRKRKSIRFVAAKSDTLISPKRRANGHAQTEKADNRWKISDTNKSDMPVLADQVVHAKAVSEVKLPESAPEVAPLVPLPPHAVTHRIVSDLGQGHTRVDYLSACGRLLAIGLAAVGLSANATFGMSMGITVWQQMLYALLWASIDGIALWLPSMAVRLWQNQHRAPAVAAWLLCAGAIYASALAAKMGSSQARLETRSASAKI